MTKITYIAICYLFLFSTILTFGQNEIFDNQLNIQMLGQAVFLGISDAQITQDANRLIIRTNEKQTIQVWDFLGLRLLGSYEADEAFEIPKITSDDQYIIMNTQTQLFVWDLSTMEVEEIGLDGTMIVDIRISPTNDFFIALVRKDVLFGATDVVMISLPETSITGYESEELNYVSIAPNGTDIAFVGYDTVFIGRYDDELLIEKAFTIDVDTGFGQVDFSCNGAYIFANTLDLLWKIDAETGNYTHLFNTIRLYPDPDCINTYPKISEDSITFIDVVNQSNTLSWDRNEFGLYRAISPDETLAIGTNFQGVNIWSLQSGDIVGLLDHPATDNVIFSSDGNFILTWSHLDDLLRVWSISPLSE